MRNIKELIARRRPSDAVEQQPAPDLTVGAPADETTFQRPVETHRVMTQESYSKAALDPDTLRKKAIVSARDRVPAPPDPRELKPRETHPERPGLEAAPAAPAQHATPKIWDLESDPVSGAHPASEAETAYAGPAPYRRSTVPAPSPAQDPDLEPDMDRLPPLPTTSAAQADTGGQRQKSSRAKTRLLGFHGAPSGQDLFAKQSTARAMAEPKFPIGWLVVMEGPGRGASFTLISGLSTVGRDPDQTVALDFGDGSISRENHVSIAYDEEDRCTYVGHGGKSNIVRLNGQPLLTTERLKGGDSLKIGKTVLQFVAFCDESFGWDTSAEVGQRGNDTSEPADD